LIFWGGWLSDQILSQYGSLKFLSWDLLLAFCSDAFSDWFRSYSEDWMLACKKFF
jgi:hypothetical protein